MIIIASNPMIVEALRLELVACIDRFVKGLPHQQLAFSDGIIAVESLLIGICEEIETKIGDKKRNLRKRLIETIHTDLAYDRAQEGK